MNNYLPLKKWKNLCKDETVFILGNGLSISSYNLDLLKNYFTIGINRIIYVFDPTILFWQDITFWEDEKENDVRRRQLAGPGRRCSNRRA